MSIPVAEQRKVLQALHQDVSHLATKTEVGQKQDKLVSGVNIKTVNGMSILR